MTAMVTPYGPKYQLASALSAAGTVLPLSAANSAALATAIGASGHAWLTLEDPLGSEVVKATVFNSTVMILRGQDSSTARAFPAGTCIDARVTYAGLKDLMCNFDCCA